MVQCKLQCESALSLFAFFPLFCLFIFSFSWVCLVGLFGVVVGYDSVKSASRMNGSVIFLDSTTKVSEVVV